MAPADAPPTAFCRSTAPVDRIDRVLDCYDGRDPYVTSSVRRGDGWIDLRETRGEVPFTPDENSHVDAALVEGTTQICAGKGNESIYYPSLHTPELGWPLWICDGQHFLVLHRGDASLELRRPLAAGMQTVYWIVGVHDFGHVVVWDD
jgi:hypothetical protein